MSDADENGTLRRKADDERVRASHRALYGDPENQVPGLIDRVTEIEEYIGGLKRIEWMFRGALLMMGILTVGNVSMLYALIQALAKITLPTP